MNELPSEIQNHYPGEIENNPGFPLVISFSKSTSANYKSAVDLAKKTSNYWETTEGKVVRHTIAISAEHSQMAIAATILYLVKGLKGTLVYSKGSVIPNASKTEDVVRCYAKSLSCNDRRAHCFKVVTHAMSSDWNAQHQSTPEYLFPCAYLTTWGRPKLNSNHPSSVVDQIQAMAVDRGCDWCPNFDPSQFKRI